MPSSRFRAAHCTVGLVLLIAGCGGSDAPYRAATATPAEPARGPLSFFVAASVDGSADLGGLRGADARCQELATEVGAGDRTWRAYLSAAGEGGEAGVNARDRIGRGPWLNARGELIARDLDELHSDRHHLDRRTALDAHGARAARAPHDILTGSDADGRLAMVDGGPATCASWTSRGDGVAQIGHDDRMDADSHDNKRFARYDGSWNAEHLTLGCSAANLADTGGGGGFYCFAADREADRAVPAVAADPATYGFRHGVNVAHWLGDNIAAREDKPGHLYGADWFDEEDVAWIAAHGFDHLRIIVGGHNWITAHGEVDEAAIARFDDALRWARTHGLGVVLAMNSLPGYRASIRYAPPPTDSSSPFTDDATRADAAYLWWLIAHRYADIGAQLRFELMNAPRAADAAAMSGYTGAALAAIRRISADRVVYVSPHDGSIDSVGELQVEDPHTIVAVAFMEPSVFTQQWDPAGPKVLFPGTVPDLAGVLAPGDPNLRYSKLALTPAWIESRIQRLVDLARAHAPEREIYVSTFMVAEPVDDASARGYIQATREAFDRHGVSWAVYDYHTGGAVRGQDGTGGPTRILDALELPPVPTPAP